MVWQQLINLDEATGVGLVSVRGVRGRNLVEAFERLYEERPEAGCWNFLFDSEGGEIDVTAHDIEQWAAADARAKLVCPANGPLRTAVITNDPYFPLWAEAMSHQFPGREIRPFRTYQEGLAFVTA